VLASGLGREFSQSMLIQEIGAKFLITGMIFSFRSLVVSGAGSYEASRHIFTNCSAEICFNEIQSLGE
jgi:hypothetical protein